MRRSPIDLQGEAPPPDAYHASPDISRRGQGSAAHLQPLVGLLVEPEDRARADDEDRALDEVWLREHQGDRFPLRRRQRTLLEDRAAAADVIEKVRLADVLLEEPAGRG